MTIKKIKIGEVEHTIAADSAKKLTKDATGIDMGTETKPVYFSGGVPALCTYMLAQDVKADSALTDTTYSAGNGLSLNSTNNQFSLEVAANSKLGGVKTTSSVNKTDGLIAVPIIEGVPYYKDTTYTQGSGITINGNQIINAGVHSIGVGGKNGTISVNTNGTSVDVSVKGLGTAAYQSTDAFDAKGAATAAEARANGYTNTEVGKAKTYAESCVANAIGDLIDNAPDALNTLNELAAALGDDANFSTTITNLIGTKLPLAGGTLTGNLIFNASTNANGTYINWNSVGGNAPYIGYAKDQSDGTFIICSMEKDTTTNGVKYYKNGLAIRGDSGNLFWKGVKVATIDDIPSIPTAIAVFG